MACGKRWKRLMGFRRKARELALQVLYQTDFSRSLAEACFPDTFWLDKEVQPEVKAFTECLVKGVMQHKNEIDGIIQKNTEHWSPGRMAMVDRNILRFSIFELIYLEDIPAKVTINEAIEIAKIYGNEESGAFVNGILDHIHHDRLTVHSAIKNGKTD